MRIAPGLKADFPREYDDWAKRPMLFLPSPLTSTASKIVHVHSDFYEKAKKYVEGGGFLYASVAADAAIPDMETIFGARLVDTAVVSEVTLKVVEPFGGLKPGDTFHYSVPGANPRVWGSLLEVKGGKVIAVDQEGRPALVANTSARERRCCPPIRSKLIWPILRRHLRKPENTHRIYEAFRNWTGVKPAFQSDQPSVEVTSLRGDHRGYAVVVNHSAQSLQGHDHDIVAGEVGPSDWTGEFQNAAGRRLQLEDGSGALRSGHRGVEVDRPGRNTHDWCS